MNIIKVILLLVVLITIHCSSPMKGGGGETTNGCVLIGALVSEDGKPAANVQVMLIHEHYNPEEDGILADSVIDTTDVNGKYAITSPGWGNFNIQAIDIFTQNCVLIKKIEIDGDSMLIPKSTIGRPGKLDILLPEKIAGSSGYVYIKGTTYHFPIKSTQDTLVIDSLPTGMIPGICFVENSGKSHLIVSNAYVTSSGISAVTSGISKTLFTSIAGNSRFDYVTSCQVDREDNIWVGTDGGGLYQLDGKNDWNRLDFPGTIQCHKIDFDGLHWIGTNEGLFLFDGTQFYPSLIDSKDTIRNNIISIFIDSTNKKWIVSSSMIFSGDKGSWKSSKYSVSGYTDLIVDESGTVWIATKADGIVADYGTSHKIYTNENSSMTTNIVNFLTLDSAGVIWAGTMDGIVRISGSDIHVFTRNKDGIDFKDIAHGVVASSGEIWYSWNSMNLSSFQDTMNLSSFQGADSYDHSFLWGKESAIKSIDVDSRGVIWVGSYGGGLLRIEHSKK